MKALIINGVVTYYGEGYSFVFKDDAIHDIQLRL